MTAAERLDRIIVAVMLDPRAVAQHEWYGKYGAGGQLARAVEAGVETVTIEVSEPPDWRWWEPRYDQPGRREATRYREIVGA